MEKEQQDIINEHKKRRRAKKIKLSIASVVTLICAVILIVSYLFLSKDYYINYKENANVDYKIYLKENEFYEEEYLGLNNDVIASLINNIQAEFNYELDLEANEEYEYDYRIVANVEVKAKDSTNSIYESSKDLIAKEKVKSTNSEIKINENVDVNYDEYNNEIKKFINLYELSSTESTLTLDMYVNIYGVNSEERINDDSKVVSLEIPLTTKTINVSITSEVVEKEGKMLASEGEYKELANTLLLIGVIVLVVGIIIFIRLIMYLLQTRSAERMYETELRNILSNYKSYIQKVNNKIEIENYEVLKIETFREILEIRDTIQKPILMLQDERGLGTEFIVINDKMAFVYTLRASEIREKLREKSKAKNNKKDEQK